MRLSYFASLFVTGLAAAYPKASQHMKALAARSTQLTLHVYENNPSSSGKTKLINFESDTCWKVADQLGDEWTTLISAVSLDPITVDGEEGGVPTHTNKWGSCSLYAGDCTDAFKCKTIGAQEFKDVWGKSTVGVGDKCNDKMLS